MHVFMAIPVHVRAVGHDGELHAIFSLVWPPPAGGVTGSLASPKGRGNNTVNEDVQELPVHGSDLSFGSSLDLLALWQQAYVVPELVTMHFCTPQGRTRPVQLHLVLPAGSDRQASAGAMPA